MLLKMETVCSGKQGDTRWPLLSELISYRDLDKLHVLRLLLELVCLCVTFLLADC